MEKSNKISVRNVILSVLTLTFLTLTSAFMLIEMQEEINMIIFWILLFSVVLFGCIFVVLTFFGYARTVKLGIVCLGVVFFVIGVFYIIYKTGYFILLEDIDALRAEISKTNSISLAFIFVQFAQVCILPIPATVTTLLGLLLFDPINAIIYSLIGMIAGAVVMFIFGKYTGRKAVDWALGKDDVQKYLDLIHGKDNAVLTAMFLLPIFPDDLLCAVAGITGMNFWYFFIVLGISRVLSTVVSVLFFSGNFIPLQGWWLLLWGIIIAILVCAVVLFFKNLEEVEAYIKQKFKRK